jgi:hypothetical protein
MFSAYVRQTALIKKMLCHKFVYVPLVATWPIAYFSFVFALHLQLFGFVLQKETGTNTKSAFFEQGLNKLSFNEKTNTKEGTVSLKLPPPPPSPVSPTDSGVSLSPFKAEFPSQEQPATDDSGEAAPFKAEFPSQEQAPAGAPPSKAEHAPHEQPAAVEKTKQGSAEDDFDFGDFQAAA